MSSRKQISALSKIMVSLALASVLGLAAYVILMGMPAPAIKWFPLLDHRNPPPVLAQDTYTYTIFLPIVFPFCQSTRPPLKDTGNFAGEVEILTPQNCTTGIPAETRVLVTGTYTGTPADATIWVLAYAPISLYYPQSPNACEGETPFQQDGEWYVPAYLGEQGGPPEWFDIVVILTGEETSQFLSDHVRRGCQIGEYIGISAGQLEGEVITEKSYITVQTLD